MSPTYGGSYQGYPSLVDVFIQQAPFSFIPGTASLPASEYFERHDMDQDGLEDLLVVSEGFTTIKQNNGDGSFTPVATMEGAYSGTWADIDGDGNQELLHSVDDVLVSSAPLINGSAPPRVICPMIMGSRFELQDLDGNGRLDVITIKSVYMQPIIITAFMSNGVFPLTASALIEIFDTSGRLVKLFRAYSAREQLHLGNINNGLYILRASSEQDGALLGTARFVRSDPER